MNKTLTLEQRISIVRLMPDAKLFIQTIKDWIANWLTEQENKAQK